MIIKPGLQGQDRLRSTSADSYLLLLPFKRDSKVVPVVLNFLIQLANTVRFGLRLLGSFFWVSMSYNVYNSKYINDLDKI